MLKGSIAIDNRSLNIQFIDFNATITMFPYK